MADKLQRVPVTPRKGVIATAPIERAMSRMFKAVVSTPPQGQAQIDLVGDAFFSLLNHAPVTKKEVPPDREVNKVVMDWLMNTPSFGDTRATTQGNRAASLSAAGIVYESLITEDALKDALKKQKEAEQEEKDAKEDEQNMMEALQDGDEKTAAKFEKSAEDHHAKAKQAAAQAVQAVEKLKKNPVAQGMINNVAKKAGDQAREVATVMAGWGMEASTSSQEEIEDVLKMVRENAELLKRLADMLGRYQQLAASTIAKVRSGTTGVVTEPALTKKVEKLFPMERMYLSPRMPRFIRLRKLQNLISGGGLLGWRPLQDAKRKGAVTILVDESGSMGGEPIKSAKMLVLGTANALNNDKSVVERAYDIYGFSSWDDKMPHVGHKDNWKAHIDWATEFLGGGTDFDAAILKAIESIRRLKDEGDVVADFWFITDGVANARRETMAEWRKLKDELGCRMLTVSIGPYINEQLKNMSDTFFVLKNPQELTTRAEELVVAITTAIIKAEGGD